MKKIIALLLVLVMALVVFSSCAKKEEPKTVKVSYTIVNNTGKNVTETTLSDQKSSNKLESKAGEGGLPDGQSTGIEMEVQKEKDMIDVMFGYTVEGGDSMMGPIVKENGTITLKLTDDGKLDFSVE